MPESKKDKQGVRKKLPSHQTFTVEVVETKTTVYGIRLFDESKKTRKFFLLYVSSRPYCFYLERKKD